MDTLSIELLYEIGELLSRQDLAQLCRVNRRCCAILQPLLFRLHGHPDDWMGPSAVFWAADMADSSDVASQTLALAVLDKVEKYCRCEPGALDRSFYRPDCKKDYRPVRQARRCSLLGGDSTKYWQSRVGTHPSFNPLHLAAHKGLDSIVVWLLAHGANANALIESTPHNALVPAVLANQTSTVLLLLAHGIDQAIDMPYNGITFDTAGTVSPPSQYRPAVTTLAAALGNETMAEKLMDSGFVPAANPSQMLYVYAEHGHNGRAFAASLLRRGAEASPRMFLHLVQKTGSRWAQLPLELLERMNLGAPLPTQTDMSSFAQKAILDLTRSFKRDDYFATFHNNHYDLHYYENDIKYAQRALRRLVTAHGVDLDACGRSLWQQLRDNAFDYALLKYMLPPFLEAGMNVQCLPKGECRKETAAPTYKMDIPEDLLAGVSRFDPRQCAKGVAMQLDVVLLLLKYGALITKATLENALRDHPVGPSTCASVGRSGWSVQLCNTLLGYCSSMAEEKHREDMKAFLALYREKTKRVSVVNLAK